MKNKLTKITIIAFAAFFVGSTHAKAPVKADRAMETPESAKKRKAGEECKTADDCKRHHRCEKQGEKNVCVAPELREIPKT